MPRPSIKAYHSVFALTILDYQSIQSKPIISVDASGLVPSTELSRMQASRCGWRAQMNLGGPRESFEVDGSGRKAEYGSRIMQASACRRWTASLLLYLRPAWQRERRRGSPLRVRADHLNNVCRSMAISHVWPAAVLPLASPFPVAAEVCLV